MRTFDCHDTGFNCDWTSQANTYDELLKKVIAHIKGDHEIKEISDELMEKLKNAIKGSD